MDGVWFLLGVVAILVIVFWEIRNDRVAPDGRTSGLLAMADETPAAATPAAATQGSPPASLRSAHSSLPSGQRPDEPRGRSVL